MKENDYFSELRKKMGCAPSSVRVHQPRDKTTHRPLSEMGSFSYGSTSQNHKNREKSMSPKSFFHSIVNNVHQISNPSDMVPQVCVGDTAFPIATAAFKLDGQEVQDIRLPVISCALKGNGKIACISSIEFLQQNYFNSFETAIFFKQLARVISNSSRTFACTYCIGFKPGEMPNFKTSFDSMGLYAESGNFPSSIDRYTVIILNTSYVLSPEQMDILYNFVAEKGHGLMVFYNPNEEAPNINDFLMRFGLRFTNLIITDDGDSIEVGQNYELAHNLTFTEFSQKYIDLVKSDDISQFVLDDLVTSLRIYVLACGDENTPRLSELLDASWEFLKKTNYIKDGKFFQNVQQSIVSMLIIDLLMKLPLDMLKPVEGYEQFPGKTGDVNLAEYEEDLVVNSQEWTSTGLWLPAGVIATIVTDDPPPQMFIQIGCHNEKNLTKQLPWDRWPSTLVTEPSIGRETSVGSPFGGIVYLMIGDEEEMNDFSVHVSFNNFCRCPRYVVGTDCWEETKDMQVPWGEIETSNSIVTMPSGPMREMDVEYFAIHLEKLVGDVKDYLGIEWKYKFRIIFDVMNEAGKPSISYPIVFSTEDIENVVSGIKTPNHLIFDLLIGISISILQNIGIDESTKIAISAVAASAALSNEFPEFSPMMIDGVEMPPLFHELWEIHTKHDKTVIPRVIASIMASSILQSDVPEDMWISFVRKLSDVGGYDFSPLLSRTRPIPLSVINSLHSFKPYQV